MCAFFLVVLGALCGRFFVVVVPYDRGFTHFVHSLCFPFLLAVACLEEFLMDKKVQ